MPRRSCHYPRRDTTEIPAMPLQYTCATCKRVRQAKPSVLAKGRRFCSFDCRDAAGRAARSKSCAVCGQIYTAERTSRPSRFCSMRCRIDSTRKPPIEYDCARCGVHVVKRSGSTANGRFCSRSCQGYFYAKSHNIGVAAVVRMTTRTPYERPIYRKNAGKVRLRDGYRCRRCGRQGAKGDRWLEVHHVKPIRLGGSDAMSNLTTLCTKCHRQVEAALRKSEQPA